MYFFWEALAVKDSANLIFALRGRKLTTGGEADAGAQRKWEENRDGRLLEHHIGQGEPRNVGRHLESLVWRNLVFQGLMSSS